MYAEISQLYSKPSFQPRSGRKQRRIALTDAVTAVEKLVS